MSWNWSNNQPAAAPRCPLSESTFCLRPFPTYLPSDIFISPHGPFERESPISSRLFPATAPRTHLTLTPSHLGGGMGDDTGPGNAALQFSLNAAFILQHQMWERLLPGMCLLKQVCRIGRRAEPEPLPPVWSFHSFLPRSNCKMFYL